jgi:hypothetical protein
MPVANEPASNYLSIQLEQTLAGKEHALMANGLALARLEAGILLVDDVGPALAADHAAVFVALLERAQGIADFHGTPSTKEGRERP